MGILHLQQDATPAIAARAQVRFVRFPVIHRR
jgi:hypothetical protein